MKNNKSTIYFLSLRGVATTKQSPVKIHVCAIEPEIASSLTLLAMTILYPLYIKGGIFVKL